MNHNKLFGISAVFVTVLMALSSMCAASVPMMTSYQGKLCDSAGQPVSDGSYSVVFTLFGQSPGETALWNESRTLQTSGGLFSVYPSSVTAIPSSAFTGTNLADGSVTNSRLTTGSVSLSKLATDSVDSSRLVDRNVELKMPFPPKSVFTKPMR